MISYGRGAYRHARSILRELLIELAQGLERVGPLEAGVVGDLVVAGEGRVDRRPALHQVREHAEHDQVADDDAHRSAYERIDPTAMATRSDIAANGSEGGDPLEDDLPEHEHQRASHVVPVREERAVARVRTLLGLHAAHGEDHVLGLAREEIPPTRASVPKEPVACKAALDLRAVRRRRAGHHDPTLLLDPAEGRDVLVGAEQDSGLARTRLRGEVGLPFE